MTRFDQRLRSAFDEIPSDPPIGPEQWRGLDGSIRREGRARAVRRGVAGAGLALTLLLGAAGYLGLERGGQGRTVDAGWSSSTDLTRYAAGDLLAADRPRRVARDGAGPGAWLVVARGQHSQDGQGGTAQYAVAARVEGARICHRVSVRVPGGEPANTTGCQPYNPYRQVAVRIAVPGRASGQLLLLGECRQGRVIRLDGRAADQLGIPPGERVRPVLPGVAGRIWWSYRLRYPDAAAAEWSARVGVQLRVASARD